MNGRVDVALTVDLEPDCLPYLGSFRGVDEGMPRLLDSVAELGIRCTFFTTADVARRAPAIVERLVSEGHELGSHSVTHPRFDRLTPDAARREIDESASVLRRFAPVTSFRAPYLVFPEEFLPMLIEAGFTVDSSAARYKIGNDRNISTLRTDCGTLVRVPASITSSALRLPRLLREHWLGILATPLVLFVHPWEFVDLRGEKLRWDCRAGTGDHALRSLRDVLTTLASRGARFYRLGSLPAVAALGGSDTGAAPLATR
jgi:peptidoglycan-N-acetylglucosamine deacetylase